MQATSLMPALASSLYAEVGNGGDDGVKGMTRIKIIRSGMPGQRQQACCSWKTPRTQTSRSCPFLLLMQSIAKE